MKGWKESVVLVVAALFVLQPVLAMAASPVRVIPTGKVSVLSDGKEASQFRSEMPLPQGSMLACDGKCLVQTQGLQLVARDKAIFALSEAQSKWDLAVKSGSIDFAISANAKQLAFHTARDLIEVQEAIIPASSDGLVRGTIAVTEDQTKLTVHQGALRIAGQDGEQLIQSGQFITLAQAKVAPDALPLQEGSGPPPPGGLSIGAKVGIAAVGLAGLGIGLGLGLSGDDETSPF
jgi:hypothetical protein